MPSTEKFKSFSIKELKSIIKTEEFDNEVIEHKYDYDEEYDDYTHIDWDCEMCDVEKELSFKNFVKFSKNPGMLPYFENSSSISKNINISEIKIGDYSKYLSRPGTSDYAFEYVECIWFRFDETIDKYIVKWRKSNSNEKPFNSYYTAKENININRKL